MQGVDIVRSSVIQRTPRVIQAEGIFDIPPSARSEERWTVNLDLPEKWNVGVIVGPSGSGKTTVARELFGDNLISTWSWPEDRSILDGFSPSMSIREIIDLLSSVGFSSPPSWVRPFRVLSNGEQFRVELARTLAEMPALAVVDEFTSVVDRTVAQIGSAALAKTVRRKGQRFIAVTCHYDVIDWLEPDWVYQPHTNQIQRECLWRRPKITLEIRRVHRRAWEMFRKHHYLDVNLNLSATCFVAFWESVPVAFASVIHFPHPKSPNIKREHRTVCLPDYQGVGIGNAVSDLIGSLCRGLGCRYVSITSHPAMIQARNRSKNWLMYSKPNCLSKTFPSTGVCGKGSGKNKGQAMRLRASFEYVGPTMERALAQALWSGSDV